MEQQRTPPAERAGTTVPPAPVRPRWRGALVALALLAGLAALAWHLTRAPAGGGRGGAGGGPGRGGPPPSTVGVARAAAADLPVYVDALGTVMPAATATVQPQVSGVLTQVLFKEGQLVRKGQLLATIDPRPFELALTQAQGQQERDEAQLDAARVTLARYRALLAQDSIARQDVDTQAATVRQLEGQRLTDQAALGTARLNLAWSRIVAPLAGRVGLRPVDPGNVVGPSTAGGVAVITQLDPIDVEFGLPQDTIPALQARLAAGAPLTATVYDRTRTRVLGTGRFLSLNNLTDTQTGTVRAKARFANGGGALFPSQFVNVRLLLDTVRGAIVVPVTALRHGPDGDFVFLLRPDHTVTMRAVTPGVSTPDRVQVTQGLALGDTVVTAGGDRLREGARVVLPADLPASGGAGRGAWPGGRGRRASAARAS